MDAIIFGAILGVGNIAFQNNKGRDICTNTL